MSYLLITHDVEVIRTTTRHILVTKDGAVVESGPASRVLSAPTHGYTKTLLAAAEYILNNQGT